MKTRLVPLLVMIGLLVGLGLSSPATINAVTGLYTAGPVSGVSDIVRVTDGVGVTSDAIVNLTASPAQPTLTISETGGAVAVANQTLTLTGTGFTNGGGATVNGAGDSSSVSIAGDPTDLKVAGGPPSFKINEGNPVPISNVGIFVLRLVIPINNTTVVPGNYLLQITDSGGLTAVITLTIRDRTLVLNPTQGPGGSTGTVSVTGFPAANPTTGAELGPTVSIQYIIGPTVTTVATLTPDASGNVS